MTSKSGVKETIHITPNVWEGNRELTNRTIKGSKDLASINIDGGIFRGTYFNNNTWNAN